MGCCCSLLSLPRHRQHQQQQQRQGITTAVQVEIPHVPPALVWEVVTDLSALPQTSPFVQGVELWKTPEPDNTTTTSKTKTCFVGQQWREERNVPGKDNHNDGNNLQTQVKTVVRMDTNDTTSNNNDNDNDDDKDDYNYRIGRTLTVNIMHKKKRNNRGTKNNSATRYSTVDVSNTCSWTVVQASQNDNDDDDGGNEKQKKETSTTTILICSIAYASAGNWGACLRRILLHYAEEYLRQELQGYKATALERHAAATAAETAATDKP